MVHGDLVGPDSPGVTSLDRPVGPTGGDDQPLTTTQLELLDDVIREAERVTGLRFSAYLGDLGANTAASAESLLDGLGADAPYAVLLAVSPGQRVVEVVTGPEAARRVSDRAARLAVLGVVSSCTDGDIGGALITGIRILADQAGTLPERSTW
ncbi:hypothetical protein Namu_1827 [Nakamurella multipartita DSM 44233]|jgi:hypothetical protein|uniref:DUF5130 domain-containing protein n=1 Tax=Nakamurella multipartita (strain ATCC 700099 / DSM 44233 / CIP 104796 / JCM 9543 / NBRC 105858 / Y-104) TaxID=479431 RepID=C8XGN4_NAKMY|nr:hypothetical protein Namu_1827 [Nakamurella multipartita DSM 44233]